MKRTSPSSSSKGNKLRGEQYLYLTTRGRSSGLLREIEIWFTDLEPNFYLIAEYPDSHWVQNLRAEPEVQVRMAGKTFPCRARIVSSESDVDLHRSVLALSREKYAWGDGLVVELHPAEA